MMTHKSALNRPSMILLIALAAMVGYQTFAYRPMAPVTPTVVVTVNLQTVFEQLNVKKAEDESLKQTAKELNDQADAKQKTAKQLENELKDHLPGTPKYQEVEKAALLAAYKYQAHIEFAKAKIEIEKGRSLSRIYTHIKAAAQKMSDENGYDIVMVDDSQAPLPSNAAEDEMNRQISARRLLHVNSKRIDVSAELIKRMNDEYRIAPAAANATPGKTP